MSRTTGSASLLLLCLFCSLPQQTMSTVCTKWPNSWIFGKCPQRSPQDAVDTLRKLLDTELSGQKVATGHITSALSANIFSKRRRPLTFHFSGPTGVGKSLCSSLVARALFSSTAPGTGLLCGLLHKKMRGYEHRSHETNPDKLDAAKYEIESEIAKQLEHCPRSIIILDDIERLSSRFLDLLEGLLHPDFPIASYWDKEGNRKMVSTRDAVFIVISDLNEEKLSPDLNHKQAIQLIRAKAKERWGESKAVALIERTVPFVPLTDDQMKQVAERSLAMLEQQLLEYSGLSWKGRLAWAVAVPNNIVTAAKAERPDENARAVTTFVEVEVRDQLYEVLDSALHGSKHPDGLVFISFNVHVDGDGGVKIEPFGERGDQATAANSLGPEL